MHTVLSCPGLHSFSEEFTEDEDGIPRTWGPKVSIASVTHKARLGAAQVLALLAANRLDGPQVRCTLPGAPLSACNPLTGQAAGAPDRCVEAPGCWDEHLGTGLS